MVVPGRATDTEKRMFTYNTPFDSIALLTDGYKYGHGPQYPKETSFVRSYTESRGGPIPWTTWMGWQYILKRYFEGVQFTKEKIDYAAEVMPGYLGPNVDLFDRKRWDHIINVHGGRAPLHIMSVPEGLRVPNSNILATITNTCAECAWLTNFVESVLMHVWSPLTVGTNSSDLADTIKHYLEATGCSVDEFIYMLHDFGFRGVSSVETAALAGFAHLGAGFHGTDNVPAVILAREFYDSKDAGATVIAYEHSTVCSWGEEREIDCYRHALTRFPNGPLSIVADSYDFWRAVEMFGGPLRELVLARKGKLVIRPDSFEDIPGDDRRLLDRLGDLFPSTENAKGYRELHPNIGMIQGDGIDHDIVPKIFEAARAKTDKGKWAANNIILGSGGGLLQKFNRDTQKMATKCCEVTIKGHRQPVFKKSGMAMKHSKRGHLKLVSDGSEFHSRQVEEPGLNVLRTTLYNGELKNLTTLAEIRALSQMPVQEAAEWARMAAHP
jgi:nicotinamide phosphoribosyltransferase